MNHNLQVKLDAGDSVFFLRELEHIKSQSYDIIYPDRGARDAFPVSYEAGEGADFITYRQYDRHGMAKIITDYSDDLPMAEVSGREFIQPVRDLGMAYQYSNKEIRSSNMVGKSLDTRRATAAVEGMEDKLNDIAWNGDTSYGLIGYFDNPNVPTGSLTTGDWDTATPQEIYDDIEIEVRAVKTQSRKVHTANEVWLTVNAYAKITGTRMADGTDTTIRSYAELNLNVVFKEYIELEGAGAGGTDRMVVIEKTDRNLTLEIPMELRVLPPEQRNLAHIVNQLQSTGGVIVYRPLAMRWADGL